MYPFPLIFVGTSPGQLDLDRAAVANSAKLVARCADLKGVRAFFGSGETIAHVFLVQLRGDEDVTLLHQINDAYPGFPIVALVEGDCDSRTLVRISRAGAAQMILSPWTETNLAESLSRVATQFGKTRSVARIVSVCGVSEGSGATTIALNLAHELAAHWRYPCILAEPIVPFGRLADYLDCRAPKSSEELFTSSQSPDLFAIQKALTSISDGLQLLTSPQTSPPFVAPVAGRVSAIVEGLQKLCRAIVLDMPYTFDESSFDLLAQADDVLLVVVPSIPSLQAMKVIGEALRRRRIAGKLHIVMNRYVNDSEGFDVSRIQEVLHVDRIWTIANDTAGFLKAINSGRPLRVCAPNSHALADFDRLLESIFGLAPKSPPAPTFFQRLFGK